MSMTMNPEFSLVDYEASRILAGLCQPRPCAFFMGVEIPRDDVHMDDEANDDQLVPIQEETSPVPEDKTPGILVFVDMGTDTSNASRIRRCRNVILEISQTLGLKSSIQDLALDYARLVNETGVYNRRPETLAPACVHWACRASDRPITVTTISRATNVSYTATNSAITAFLRVLQGQNKIKF